MKIVASIIYWSRNSLGIILFKTNSAVTLHLAGTEEEPVSKWFLHSRQNDFPKLLILMGPLPFQKVDFTVMVFLNKYGFNKNLSKNISTPSPPYFRSSIGNTVS